jgi:phosphoglycolate phosphatase-like HAD superfamily hydrolase
MKNIVTDFDGVVTDVVKESTSFEAAYLDGIARKFSLPLPELVNMVVATKKTIENHPGKYGWEMDGVIVVDAHADPYMYTQTATFMALTEMISKGYARISAEYERDKPFYNIFAEAYTKAGLFFRPFAKEYLLTLHRKANLTIVTNSRTDSVNTKLVKLLGPDHGFRVVGNAQKMKLDRSWNKVPDSIIPAGFPRPVYLRRKQYGGILELLSPVHAVCGDVWELDLSLPEYLGIKTVFLLTEMTPKWEKRHYINHFNGYATPSLETALKHLLSD